MDNLGAIPKAKGGARPKTKLVNNQITRKSFDKNTCRPTEQSINGTNYLGVFSLNDIPDNCDKTINRANDFDQKSSCTEPKIAFCKPLEERQIFITDQGVQMKRFALNAYWVEERTFIHYTRPPLASIEGDFVLGAVDAWTEQMEFLVEDLSWLLNLPHYKFWSQMVFDKRVHEWLESYLTSGPRWYDATPEDEGCQAVMREIYQSVFRIYLRMATFKESKEDYITPSTFGDLIYNHFLFDVCKMLDLCALYGSTNRPLLEKVIANVFTYQTKYYSDLEQLVLSLKYVLENLENKLGIFDATAPRSVQLDTRLGFEELHDAVYYILDAFGSLQAFLSIFPKACQTFHEKEFEIRLSTFYEKCIPKLLEDISGEEGSVEDELFREDLLQKVGVVRASCLAVFREILKWSSLRGNSNSTYANAAILGKNIEIFTQILTSCCEEKVFISDYYSMYGLDEDIELYQSRGADMMSLNFVKEAVESISTEMQSHYPDKMDQIDDVEVTDGRFQPDSEVPDTSGMNGYFSAETKSMSSIEIHSLISSVQDLLPDLGSGFVNECLKYYNYSSEEVVNAVLEGNLPPCIEELDRGLALKESDLNTVGSEDIRGQADGVPDIPEEAAATDDNPDVLVSRLNVYDDDEFDVFKQPSSKFDRTKVRKGKTDRVTYEKDPEITDKVKSIIQQYECNAGYSIYEDEEKYSPLRASEYDDEYDDTYDDNETGDIDNFGPDRRKGFVGLNLIRGRGALNTRGLNFTGEDEDESEGEADEGATEQKDPIYHGNQRGHRFGGKELQEEPRQEGDRNTEGRNAKFKRANVSYKRGNVLDEENWNRGGPSVFTNSKRGARNQSRVNEEVDPNTVPPLNPTQPAFVPFCENPEETRRRRERMRQSMQFRNKGYSHPSSSNQYNQNSNNHSNQQNQNSNDPSNQEQSGGSFPYRPKTTTKGNKHSGKSWRQGTTGDDETRRSYGGNYKEDTNHGQAQDKNYRHKMVHKNEQRRSAAQAKYRNNF